MNIFLRAAVARFSTQALAYLLLSLSYSFATAAECKKNDLVFEDPDSMEAREEYQDFLEKFQSNVDFRRSNSSEKIQRLTIDKTTFRPIEDWISFDDPSLFLTAQTRAASSFALAIDKRTSRRLEVSLRDSKAPFRSQTYFFRRQCGWKLYRVEDWHFPDEAPSAWLLNIFPRLRACTPINLYFDADNKESFGSRIEAHGYSAVQAKDPRFMIYRINESFLGAKAVALTIPREFESTISITFSTSPSVLQSTILRGFGQHVEILVDQTKADSGVAFIHQSGQGAALTCKTIVN